MKQDISLTRVRLCFVGLALVLAAVVGFLIGIVSELKCGKKPGGLCCRNATQAFYVLRRTDLTDLFRSQSSKASMFLKATAGGPGEEKMGQVRWAKITDSHGAALEEGRGWIRVDEAGLYLLFVQAVYSLRAAEGGTSISGGGSVVLHFKVLVKHRTGNVEEYSSIYDQRYPQEEEIDVVLSQSVLVWMEAGNHLAVNASHREIMDYHSNPYSSFLTLIKYSDLS
ncbi:hypothetical protein AAFF_G00196960 [Aldrovandia affinis]|uniref:THD domain-containing protein n=1 Tax=Aldrovandia affinis TaxID=143900 RepID=A0AAD7RIP3_9TELE|nr:hypothetical protein AAFF_G00196960 [Aldrovandia affinis]